MNLWKRHSNTTIEMKECHDIVTKVIFVVSPIDRAFIANTFIIIVISPAAIFARDELGLNMSKISSMKVSRNYIESKPCREVESLSDHLGQNGRRLNTRLLWIASFTYECSTKE